MAEIKSPFDFVKNLKDKSGESYSDDTKSNYNPFIVNRSLSMGSQTILFANEMNRKHHIDKDMQYDFYYHGMPKTKSFDKWIKGDKKTEDIELVTKFFQCSFDKASEIINILDSSQLSEIKNIFNQGGKNKS